MGLLDRLPNVPKKPLLFDLVDEPLSVEEEGSWPVVVGDDGCIVVLPLLTNESSIRVVESELLRSCG